MVDYILDKELICEQINIDREFEYQLILVFDLFLCYLFLALSGNIDANNV
jgi:hypothetical protein